MSNDILNIEHVSYRYFDRIPALENISLGISEGETLAVIGSNGSGKSTLMQVAAGLLYPQEGRVLFRGVEVNEKALRAKAFMKQFRSSLGFVFQDSDVQLFCPSVMDELMYGPLQLGLGEDEASDRAMGILAMLGIEGLKHRPSYMLSGGEKKKVAIGSVLTMNPEIILVDEPTNGLDPRTQCTLMEVLMSLREAGKTIIIATHDLSLVDELQAGVAVLSEEHCLVRRGEAAEILADEELLLSVNLIHEHRHFHGKEVHSHLHSHYSFHKH